jgi:uncharacterized protein YndB with AHSA1/START domain
MARMQSSVVINRPVEEVFAFVAAMENDAQWRLGIAEMDVTTPPPFAVGSETREVLRFLGRTYVTTARCTAYEPHRRVAFRSLTWPQPVAGWRLVEPATGGTRVTHALEAEPVGWLGRLILPLQVAIMRRQMRRESQRLKALLEAGPAPDRIA